MRIQTRLYKGHGQAKQSSQCVPVIYRVRCWRLGHQGAIELESKHPDGPSPERVRKMTQGSLNPGLSLWMQDCAGNPTSFQIIVESRAEGTCLFPFLLRNVAGVGPVVTYVLCVPNSPSFRNDVSMINSDLDIAVPVHKGGNMTQVWPIRLLHPTSHSDLSIDRRMQKPSQIFYSSPTTSIYWVLIKCQELL